MLTSNATSKYDILCIPCYFSRPLVGYMHRNFSHVLKLSGASSTWSTLQLQQQLVKCNAQREMNSASSVSRQTDCWIKRLVGISMQITQEVRLLEIAGWLKRVGSLTCTPTHSLTANHGYCGESGKSGYNTVRKFKQTQTLISVTTNQTNNRRKPPKLLKPQAELCLSECGNTGAEKVNTTDINTSRPNVNNSQAGNWVFS